MSKRFTLIAIAVLLFAVAIALLSSPIETAYHVYELDRLHNQMYVNQTITKVGFEIVGGNGEFAKQKWHCKRLSELGHYFHAKYEMENLPDTKEVHRALWNRVQIEFPDQRYVTLTYPTNILEVWDHSGNRIDWESFVDRCNIKEFADSLVSE